MDHSDSIATYLQTLEFKKKRRGGCDEEDVLLKFKEISKLYQTEIARREDHVAAADARVVEYKKLSAEVRQLMESAQGIKESLLKRAKKDSAVLMLEAQSRADDLVEQAILKADNIVQEARDQADAIVEGARTSAEQSHRSAEETITVLLSQNNTVRSAIRKQAQDAQEKLSDLEENLGQVKNLLSNMRKDFSPLGATEQDSR